MSLELIKFGFTAGELAPSFYGRPDLEKFDFGLAKAYNWFVDYRGGLTTRPGTYFREFLKDDDKPIMMFEFRFNTALANTYNMIFGHQYIRFVQDGAYITETAKTPTAITKANPGVVTSNAHGYSNGDWLKLDGIGGMTELNGRTVIVAGVTANTFQLTDHTGANINTTGFGTFTAGGNLRRVYTVVSPYHSDDVAALCATQYRDRVTITHKDYRKKTLTRIADTNWVLADVTLEAGITYPTNVGSVSNNDDNWSASYVVTAVTTEGEESLPSAIRLEKDAPDWTAVPPNEQVTVSWDPVAGALYYNVYRSIYFNAAQNKGADMGFIGKTYGTEFLDRNITPDFTKTPPQHNDPFAPGKIESITITNQGTTYAVSDTVTITDAGGGSGFRGELIIEAAGGKVAGIRIISPGHDYVTPVVVITTATGSGAAFTVQVGETTGLEPGLNVVHQQRQVYAASDTFPLTLWGSRPGFFDNFDVSSIVAENDSYEFELDSGDLTPIKHLMVVRGGMLCLTETGIWVVNGGNESTAITPTNVLADPHTFVGCSEVRPVRIDTDLIYVEHKGFTVRELAYNDFSKLYSGTDISILSNHFFTQSQEIRSWSYASDPHKIIWAAKADGKFLSLTIVKDQKVYGWCEHGTKGFVERFITIEENGADVVYMIVQRAVNGAWRKYLETMASAQIDQVEDAHIVDSGLSLNGTTPLGTCLPSSSSGAVTFTVSGATPFAPGDVGKVLRMGGGKAIITGYTSSTVLTGTWVRDMTNVIPETTIAMASATGNWTLDTPVTSVSGLHHLEGETVQVLGDGNVLDNAVVTAGRITLSRACTRVSAGLAYRSIAKSLPVTINGEVVEGARKRVVGLALRLLQSRGLKAGSRLDKLYSLVKIRTNEPLGEPTRLFSGIKPLSIQPYWNEDGQVWLVRDDPTPVSILGYITSTEFGDDPQ